MKVGDKIYTDDSTVSYEATEADVIAYEEREARIAAARAFRGPAPQEARDQEARTSIGDVDPGF